MRSPSDWRTSSESRISPSWARAASVCARCVGRPLSGNGFGAAQNLPLGDTDAQCERAGDPPRLIGKAVAQHESSARGAFGLVAVRSRNTEDRQDTRTDATIGEATELRDRLLHARLKLHRQRMRFLCIEACLQFEQAFEAHDEHDSIAQLRGCQPLCGWRRYRRILNRQVVAIGIRFGDSCRATFAHQLAIELLGGRLRCDIQFTSERIATQAILPQRFRIRVASRMQLHERAMRGFVQRLERDQADARIQCSIRVVGCDAKIGQLVQHFAHLLAQREALGAQPFLEGGGARVETIQQIAAIVADGLLQRCAGAGGDRATEGAEVAADQCTVDGDGFAVGEQPGLRSRRQRLAQCCERLSQARACEFLVGIFPEQVREPVATVGFAGTQSEVGEQRASLARWNADLRAGRVVHPKRPQHLQGEFAGLHALR